MRLVFRAVLAMTILLLIDPGWAQHARAQPAVESTPPEYPVPGSILRVPGSPVSVRITQYAGWNPGPHASQATRTVSVSDTSAAAALADEINHLPDVAGGTYFCPWDDNSHITLIFTNADDSQHVIRIDIRGCQFVHAPPAPDGRLFDDPQLLPRVQGLLTGTGSHAVAPPFDARTLKAVNVHRLGGTSGRFLSTGQNGSHVLYLSSGNLFMAPSGGGSARLLVRGIADAAFTINDAYVVARPRPSADLSHLVLINTRSRKSSPFSLPRQASLLGRVAGAGPLGLSDAMQCDLGDAFYRHGRTFGGIDPEHPADDQFTYPNVLPSPSPGELIAVGCSGSVAAVYRPGHQLAVLQLIGVPSDDIGHAVRRLPVGNVSFLSWAPDEAHLAYCVDATVSVVNVDTGRTRVVFRLGRGVIHGAAWDPWSRVLALSVSPPGEPQSSARILLTNVRGKGTGSLSLPFAGAGRLEWSPWTGTSLGITRTTSHGTQAWVASLPSLPTDPGASLG